MLFGTLHSQTAARSKYAVLLVFIGSLSSLGTLSTTGSLGQDGTLTANGSLGSRGTLRGLRLAHVYRHSSHVRLAQCRRYSRGQRLALQVRHSHRNRLASARRYSLVQRLAQCPLGTLRALGSLAHHGTLEMVGSLIVSDTLLIDGSWLALPGRYSQEARLTRRRPTLSL
jgi:hypothetical protein